MGRNLAQAPSSAKRRKNKKADRLLRLVSRENKLDHAPRRKTHRAGPVTLAKSTCRPGFEAQSESKGTAHAARENAAEESATYQAKHRPVK
jgi:hypothetical protein